MAKKRVLDHIRDSVLSRTALMPEWKIPKDPKVIAAVQWDQEFETNMRAALHRAAPWAGNPGDEHFLECLEDLISKMRGGLTMGIFRYVPLLDQRKVRTDYDQVGQIIARFRVFEETGNREYLADAANFCLATNRVSWYPVQTDAKVPKRYWTTYWPYVQTGKLAKMMHHLYARYVKTGSSEALPLMAAYCALEWAYTEHPDAHFERVDDGMHMGN